MTYPTGPAEFSVQNLSAMIAAWHPGASVRDFKILESKVYGDGMVSSAGRLALELEYGPVAPPGATKEVVIKVAKGDRVAEEIYRNEVAIYSKLLPIEGLEAPRAFGGGYDGDTGTFCLILEDLRLREAVFPTATLEVTLPQVRVILDQMARLHATYWQSPKLTTDLAWMETHQAGPMHVLFNDPGKVPAIIAHLTETVQFKREMVQRLGTTVPALFEGTRLLQQHQASLPQTVLHGDSHIGNTYLLPGDMAGLLDWQLSVRGFCLHDVTYLIVTALSVEMRRQNERELLQYYLERLRAHGVRDPISFETAWLEYRRAAVWGVYIGWLTTPVVNYGWEICVMAHLRVMTAYEDLETGKLLDTMR